jgi:c-di-GMP-binding flagellar brake protein YcgR
MEERRKFPRIGVSFPIECKGLLSKNYFYTVSRDLSLVGIKILTNSFIAKDNFVRLNVNLIDRILDLKAKVIWCNKERASERYSAGLEFVEIDKSSRDELSRFINNVDNS